jgi:hypothetical protein
LLVGRLEHDPEKWKPVFRKITPKTDGYRQVCARKTTKPPRGGSSFSHRIANLENLGAGEGIRTLDPDLGKVVLYH